MEMVQDGAAEMTQNEPENCQENSLGGGRHGGKGSEIPVVLASSGFCSRIQVNVRATILYRAMAKKPLTREISRQEPTSKASQQKFCSEDYGAGSLGCIGKGRKSCGW